MMEMEPGAWWYNWATLSLGEMKTETWSSSLGVGHMDLVLKKILLRNPKKINCITNLAESSEEGCASKGCFANDDEIHEVPILGQMKPVATSACCERLLNLQFL
jgi:hypothetical protein